MKLQAYVTLEILCNHWIESKIRRNVYENFKIWKQHVSIFSTFYCKPFCMEAVRHKCYFNVFLRLSTDTITPERKGFFFKIAWQIFWKSAKSMSNCQLPILWRNHQNENLYFRNFLWKYERRIRHKKLHDKDQKIYTNSFCFYVLNELMPEFFHNSYEILMKIMQNK